MDLMPHDEMDGPLFEGMPLWRRVVVSIPLIPMACACLAAILPLVLVSRLAAPVLVLLCDLEALASLARRGRVMSPSRFWRVVREGRGTLILEPDAGCGRHTRARWTDEAVAAPEAASTQGAEATAGDPDEDPSFDQWCFDRYLDSWDGRASLVAPFRGERLRDRVLEMRPDVMTVTCRSSLVRKIKILVESESDGGIVIDPERDDITFCEPR